MRDDLERPKYLPNAAQIRAGCREIQETWDAREEMMRRGVRPGPIEVPRVHEPWQESGE